MALESKAEILVFKQNLDLFFLLFEPKMYNLLVILLAINKVLAQGYILETRDMRMLF